MAYSHSSEKEWYGTICVHIDGSPTPVLSKKKKVSGFNVKAESR